MADDIKLVIGVDDRDLIRTQKEQKKFERNLLIIESAFRKGDITAKRYTAELNKQAKQLSRLGGSYNKANSEVRKYSASLRKATDDQLRMTQATNMAGKSTNRFGMYAQQVGYQVGDFFVQVQSGTSALVAFGQQGTQLAGLLPGVAGAVIGISLAIGTMLLRSFLETKKATKDASAGFVDYEASLKSAKEETQSMSEELMVLEGNFRSVAHAALDKALRDAEAALNKFETDEVKTRRMSEEARKLRLKVLRDSVQVAQDNLDKHLELNTTLSKTASLEEARLNSVKLFYEYRQRDADAAKKLAEAVEEIKKEQEAVNRSAREQLRSEIQKIELLKAEIEFGKESVRYRNLVALTEDANLRRKLKAKNVDKDIIDAIINQLDVQRTLSQEISDSADAAERLKNNLEIASSFRVGGDLGEFANVAGGLDAFGGAGSFKYGGSQKFKPDPKKETAPAESAREMVAQLIKEVEHRRRIVGLTDEQARYAKILFKLQEDNAKKRDPLNQKQLEQAAEYLHKIEEQTIAIEEQKKAQEELGEFIETKFENAMMSIVDGTKSVKDAFRTMAADVVKELYRVFVLQKAIAAFKMAGRALGFFEDGAAFSNGKVTAYADGGVVASPTYFPMAGGNTGLMGEAGPEAIMPLKRGANGKLGVQAEGVGTTIVNQTINVSTGVQQTVRTEIKSLMPQIAESAKFAVLDAKRRGGSYGRTL